MQQRNRKSILAALCLIVQSLEINKSAHSKVQSVQDQLQSVKRQMERQADLLRETTAQLAKTNDDVAELEKEKVRAEAENARLRDELAALKRQTPRAPQATKGFWSKVLMLRPDLIEAIKTFAAKVTRPEARNVALIIHQFSYLLEKGFGKVLDDGRRYIYGTYSELHSEYFSSILSERTLRRYLKASERLGFVNSKQPEGSFSRRKYYALSSEAAKLATSGKMAASTGQISLLPEAAKLAPSINDKGENAADDSVASPDSGEICSVAATATDSLDLIEKLKPHFPLHDVGVEYDRYFAHRKKAGRPAIAVSKNPKALSFVKWMSQAHVPLGPAKKPKLETSPGASTPPPPEEVDPKKHAEFMEELAFRKKRRLANQTQTP